MTLSTHVYFGCLVWCPVVLVKLLALGPIAPNYLESPKAFNHPFKPLKPMIAPHPKLTLNPTP